MRYLDVKSALKQLLFVAMGICFLFSSLPGQQVIYVSKKGNDDWSGRLVEPAADGKDGPLATLEAAKMKVRDLRNVNGDQAYEVQIRGGLYWQTETVVFSAADSGTQTNPVIYKALSLIHI